MNSSKRFIQKLRQDFPNLGLLIGGDALFSKQPIIEDVLRNRMHYLFAARPSDHKYMMEWIDAYDKLNEVKVIDKKCRKHYYEWMNEEILYRNSWVSDLVISNENILTLVKAGRCRWKNENECFNVMKNHGYCIVWSTITGTDKKILPLIFIC